MSKIDDANDDNDDNRAKPPVEPAHRRAPSIDSLLFAVGSGITNQMKSHYSSPLAQASNLNANDSESISSYGASSNDSGSAQGEFQNFNSVDYLFNSLNNAMNNNNSILDRALVSQAQTSGIIKAKSVELKNLKKEVAIKLDILKSNITGDTSKLSINLTAGGSKKSFKEIFSNCQKNLVWCERHLNKLNEKVNNQYPIEYNEAKEQVMSRSSFNRTDDVDRQFLRHNE